MWQKGEAVYECTQLRHDQLYYVYHTCGVALGCLIIPIIICLAKEFIQQTQRLRVWHTCDNHGLVDQLSQLYKQERYRTIPDTVDNDFTIPTAHWAKKNDSQLI